MGLISLNIGQPKIEASAPVTFSDVKAMEDLFLTIPSKSGIVVTPEKAKRCAAVLACMRGISEDLGALPCYLYERGPNGEERAEDHTVNVLIDSAPNDVMTPMELKEHIIFDLMLFGNFYVLKNENVDGTINNLWPLQAGYVIRRAQELFWNYNDPTTATTGTFTADTVWRGTILSSNGLDGVAITLLAREAIGLLLAAEEQGARLFKNGVQTDLAISADEVMDDDAITQLRDAFMRRHAGAANAWMPLLLQGGAKANRIGLTAQESQYIEARAFQIQDIARAFRYPEVLLGSSGKGSKASTYASAEQFFQSYTKHTLTPWAVRIEQTMQRDLLTAKERQKFTIKHDFSSLLRGDTTARFASYKTAIASGFMQPAEARRKEGWAFVSGLDYFVDQRQQAGNSDAAASVKPTDESALARRVAQLIIGKEQKALVGSKQDPDIFYSHFGGFLEDITGADVDSVGTYLEMRRTTSDRFSPESKTKAIDSLISLCKKDK